VTSPETDHDTRPAFDPTTPSPARMYDYYLGGKNHFPADREAAEQAMALVPQAREVAWANRRFLVRAVRAMAQAGIKQYIDLGTGYPTSPNVHEIAREIRPDARVVYVDNDPVVNRHSAALLAQQPDVIAIEADIREPGGILGHPRVTELIDFRRPVGVLAVAVLHFVTDEQGAGDIVTAFRSRMAPRSMLAISHITSDGTPTEVMEAIGDAYRDAAAPAVFRTTDRIAAFFAALPMLEPGLVEVSDWRRELRDSHVASTLRILGGVARRKRGFLPWWVRRSR
jgi:hypothetical protein